MKNKKIKIKSLIIIIAIIVGLILLGIGGYFYYDKIYLNKISDINLVLNGDDNIMLNINDEYDDPFVNASFRGEDISYKVTKYTNFNNRIVGDYVIDYKINYQNKEKSISRHIKVVDNISPEITLKGKNNISIYVGTKYKDAGATAEDNYDGNITKNIIVENKVDTSTEGNYTVKYFVEDSSGNHDEKVRNVEVKKRPIVHHEGVAVLNYHFFYQNGSSCAGANCLKADKFEEHLKYLNDNGYKTLTMEEFRAWMYNEINVPQKSVLITIDDGALGTGKQNGNILIPLLEKYKIHATLFLITGWWSKNNYISEYLDIESHSNDMHTEGFCQGVRRGAKMLCLSHDEVLNDLKASIDVTGSKTAFCYPFYAYNEAAIANLKEAGFKLAFAGGDYKATRGANKYAIPRFHITSNITLDEFISYII